MANMPAILLTAKFYATAMRLGIISLRMSEKTTHTDEDLGKGAVEQDRPDEETNVSFGGQSGHRDQDSLLKSSDSDFPEPGQNEEHTGEPQGRNQLNADTAGCGKSEAEGTQKATGSSQKENQNKSKDDPLAS